MGAAVQLEAFEIEGSPMRAASSPAGASPENASPEIHVSENTGRQPEADDFSWSGEDVVVEEQRPIAVYRNRFGGIVIREQSPAGDDEDHFVVLRDQDAAKRLIAALQRQIGGRTR